MSNLEQIKEISTRMKALREIHEMSEDDLAKKLNIDLEAYKNYEAALCDIPIGFLNEFAHFFNVELISLLTGEEPKLRTYTVVKKDKGLKIDRRKQYDYQSLAYNFVGKRMEPFLVKVPVKDEDAPVICSSHEGQEFNYVLEGQLEIVIGKHQVILEAGDSIYFNANAKHGMKALGNKEARFLAIII